MTCVISDFVLFLFIDLAKKTTKVGTTSAAKLTVAAHGTANATRKASGSTTTTAAAQATRKASGSTTTAAAQAKGAQVKVAKQKGAPATTGTAQPGSKGQCKGNAAL